ncbi:MAG: aldehyde ferredoxin oxidoreductase family protein [Candidatus Saccharicenans sp.]|uniref:aldehyde ferredoxin oxidoreductase family protein n=1 Tax=Candidatus Saccharicenans sp. TaxID=2819258 RepID=UPI00404B4253
MAIAGYHGRVLAVDLSSGAIKVEPLAAQDALLYLGGRGLGTKLLYDRIDPGADPLGLDNVVVIATSPLIGTQAPTAARGHMVYKSPLTGYIGTSNSGGAWAYGFKATGYDALIIRGRASHPVFIDISPEKVEIMDATHLWGKTTHETTEILTAESRPGDPYRALVIGPAGESLVLFAAVANEKNRVYGRCGPGAVFGSKNLKAVRVRGKEKIAVADEARYRAGLDQALYLMKQAPITKRLLRELGTSGLILLINLINMLPHRNFLDVEHDEEKLERVSGEYFAHNFLEKAGSCYLCPIGCQRHTAVKSGDGSVLKGEGPEYETAVMTGPVCDIYDPEAIIRANYRANELGLDTISFGGTVACAMELYEKGYLTPEQTGGLELRFGRDDLLEKLVELTAYRQGIGALLADGSYRLAQHCGHPELAMHVKKLEIPGYDPRASYAQALGYMTSPTGACHLRGGYAVSLAFFGGTREIPRFSLIQSPIAIRNMQNTGILQDSLGVCRFTGFAFSVDPWARMVSGITGQDFSTARLEEIANRIATLERLFNLEAGLNPEEEDLLPARFAEVPIVAEGKPRAITLDQQRQMRRDYYRARGWNDDGRLSQELLRALRIESEKVK